MKALKELQKEVLIPLKSELGRDNIMALPKIVKVVINVSTGSAKDRKRNDFILERLAKIVGQQPALRSAKKSIASFKLRQGDKIGVMVTLRGEKMNQFLDKLIHIAIPRTRDFRGLKKSGVDEMGNLTIGVKEHTIFPETADEDIKDVFGMSITIVTTAHDKREAEAFFTHLGFPFKKPKKV